ncbi:MAG: hypothetical protein HWD61_02185 [Parachlamydiaceae bacterium]|nr:MAG: hypothetical protein HWD61_02185 [Parachlamydiaceae bacterium]
MSCELAIQRASDIYHPVDCVKIGPFNQEEQEQRFQQLKEALAKIHSTHINGSISYNNDLIPQSTTLLIHALKHIKDPDQLLEIVTLLKEKGADINVRDCPVSGEKMDPIKIADDRNDIRLLCVLLDQSPEQISREAVDQACDLMYEDWVQFDGLHVFTGNKFSIGDPYELKKRFEDLKRLLYRVLPEHVNTLITYKLSRSDYKYTVTLLIQALRKIKIPKDVMKL